MALAMSLPLSAYGQPSSGSQGGMLDNSSVGIMAGLHFGTINIEGDSADFLDTSFLTGLSLGAFTRLPMPAPFSMQIALQYIEKGSVIDPDTVFIDPLEFHLAYLELPVLVRYDIPAGTSRLQPYFYGGATLAVLVSAKAVANGDEDDIKDELEDLDFSLAVGAGFVLGDFGRVSLFADLRYTHGLVNISNDPDADPVENRGISFMLGAQL